LPTTVTGQVKRLRLFVDYVREAYVDIQNAHRMWRWLQGYFIGDTIIGQTRYEAGNFDDQTTVTPIDRFSQWGFKGSGDDIGVTMYLTTTGAVEEGPLRWLEWDTFYDTQLRGVQTPGKPQFYSITNDQKLIVSPPPDDVYTLRGRYRKSAQYLANDIDIPEMPVEFHTIIKDAALCYVEAFDEGPRIPVYRLRMLPNFSMLESHQLPKVLWGAPLA
jgi:hypothetical protein